MVRRYLSSIRITPLAIVLIGVLIASSIGFALGPRGASGVFGLVAVLSAALLVGGAVAAPRPRGLTAQLIEQAARDVEGPPALDEEAWAKARERYGR